MTAYFTQEEHRYMCEEHQHAISMLIVEVDVLRARYLAAHPDTDPEVISKLGEVAKRCYDLYGYVDRPEPPLFPDV